MLAGEHLAAAERPYAWLGSQKASGAAAALIARLGDDAPPMLTRLQVGSASNGFRVNLGCLLSRAVLLPVCGGGCCQMREQLLHSLWHYSSGDARPRSLS